MKKRSIFLLAIMVISILCSSLVVSAKTPTIKYGDVRKDGTINIIDLVALKKELANEVEYSSCPSCDCNRDRILNAEDIEKLVNHILGKEEINQYLVVEQQGGGDNNDFGSAINN